MNRTLGIVAVSKYGIWWLRVLSAMRGAIGWCLEKTQAPANLRPFEFIDPASDETIYLYTTKRYSVFCVGEKRFYFSRLSGKFDGMSAPSSLVSGWVEFCD
ncbi:MAG TPA: hypothetical protein VKS20_04355 [Candidatus Acidoferrales bacterium]|nr:hypothetical protein [Candidatus Acidoferrales bacterium]